MNRRGDGRTQDGYLTIANSWVWNTIRPLHIPSVFACPQLGEKGVSLEKYALHKQINTGEIRQVSANPIFLPKRVNWRWDGCIQDRYLTQTN